jgi:hypothetical protein
MMHTCSTATHSHNGTTEMDEAIVRLAFT